MTADEKDVDDKKKTNMLNEFLKDFKERVDSLLHYYEKSSEKSSDAYLELRSVMKNSRLRFLELTVNKPNTSMEHRCCQMPQCILEALIVEIGIVAYAEKFSSA